MLIRPILNYSILSSVGELLEGMKGFSRNDDVKKLFGRKGVINLILTLLNTCTDENELGEAALLLWELSFDEGNKKTIQVC